MHGPLALLLLGYDYATIRANTYSWIFLQINSSTFDCDAATHRFPMLLLILTKPIRATLLMASMIFATLTEHLRKTRLADIPSPKLVTLRFCEPF
jgi:hypothetical protein